MERSELARVLGAPSSSGAATDGSGTMVVAAADPKRFMQDLASAAARGGTVLLADPAWGEAGRARLDALIRSSRSPAGRAAGWLGVPTGGTGGGLRLARHDEKTLEAAVGGFARHFGVERVNAVGVLPLHHVSGLMGWVRPALTGGAFVPWDWKALERGDRPELPRGEWFLSLVPTQLARLLESAAAVDWLRRFRAVLVGGGPAWGELLERAAAARLPLAPSYGMTETAAMVTALLPEEFLAGARSSGRPMPHVGVSAGVDGAIRVGGASVFRGYFPDWREPGDFETSDAGRIDAAGHLHVLGRRDAIIITGGEKVQPEEVEAVLRTAGALREVVVVGVPDERWGQRVVGCHPEGAGPEPAALAEASERLAAWQRPKHWVAVAPWPVNAQGKIDRAEVARCARRTL